MDRLDTVLLTLDGKPHPVPANTSLAALVASLDHQPNKVSTAVNGLFVPRGQRGTCVLRDGDAVLLFQPIVGG
ncbi:MAG: thiS [Ramlibacter sp.]|nr:thiS [Ramlibacter sp.]